MAGILYKELSYQLQGCFYQVRNKYQRGHKEIIYQKALEEELTLAKINYDREHRINIYSVTTNKKIGVYIPDFVIENRIVVELKAAQATTQDMKMQLWHYLKNSQYQLGYLVNFGESDFKPLRFIHTQERKKFLFADS